MQTEYETETTVTYTEYDEDEDDDEEDLPFGDGFEETVPLDKAAAFLARNYEPPYWFKNGEVREWKNRMSEYDRKEAWKSLLRTVAIDEEDL